MSEITRSIDFLQDENLKKQQDSIEVLIEKRLAVKTQLSRTISQLQLYPETAQVAHSELIPIFQAFLELL